MARCTLTTHAKDKSNISRLQLHLTSRTYSRHQDIAAVESASQYFDAAGPGIPQRAPH